MKFTITTAIVSLALANLGLAAPAAEPVSEVPDVLAKRELGGLYLCPAFNWGTQPGIPCAKLVLTKNQCITLSDTYRFTLSAVGPDEGTWCALYNSQDCSNGSPGFTYPGLSTLSGSTYGKYNDNTGSIKCWWD